MRITKNNIQDIFKAKEASIEEMERLGYELVENLFCDSSGLGHENEPALTSNGLVTRVNELLDTHEYLVPKITGAGQFQVYIGLFKKAEKTEKVKKDKWGSNREVAQAYADDMNGIHSLHMFIDGRTIYSYGSHFPISYRTGKYSGNTEIVLFNSDGYSNTTRRHKSYVYSALYSSSLFVEMPTNELKNYIDADQNDKLVIGKIRSSIVSELIKTSEEFAGKAKRARKEWNREYYAKQAEKFVQQVEIVKNILIPLHPVHV